MNFNLVDDPKALKQVLNFHRERIRRFMNGTQFKEVENVSNLQYSKAIVLEINKKLDSTYVY